MNSRQFAVVCVLVAVGAGALAVPSVAFHTAGVEAVQMADDDAEFGTQVSSFAQASATDASESVDAGLWEIRANASEDPGAEVRNRTASLETRLDRLEERIEELENRREDISKAEYTARASALRVQAANIRSHVERTNATATRKGVSTEGLAELRNRAANTTGPEVAAAARNITDTPRGPPGSVGPPGNDGEAGPPSESPGGGDANGPPANGGQADPGNHTDRGSENGLGANESDRGGSDRGGSPDNASSDRRSGPHDGDSASADRDGNDSGESTPGDRGSNGDSTAEPENADTGSGTSGQDPGEQSDDNDET